ncbi:MAG: sigma-54 dependent transcriptional regulator [Desulfobacterota bacterium]|nr:sigma-54 dependent transcriptional regulator [Thermodesulfobacteriota bacterium]
MVKILVVDDEPSIREMLMIYLQREGYAVTCAADGEIALACCEREQYDVVIADIKMPKIDGLTLLHKVHAFSPETIFIMITAFGSFETAQESMHEDAYDYITKPFDVEEIKKKIESALVQRQHHALPSAVHPTNQQSDDDIIWASSQMQRVFDLVRRAATTKTTVLITGESGTGKELVARAIHRHSVRAEQPFVVINCGGIPETLLESELFGYRKGAFTGAVRDKKGLIETAHGGTLFLDEVGDLPLSLQVKLLRVVQEKTFMPVGGTEEIKVDVRIISATNKDLAALVRRGLFREDLYYRLNVIHIAVPPLRERPDDIPVLSRFFLKKYAEQTGKQVTEISSFAMDCLMHYHFPGNVRELENIIERGVALSRTSIMLPDTLNLGQQQQEDMIPSASRPFIGPEGIMLDRVLAQYERAYIEEALRRAQGSIKEAARLLGITYKSMRVRLEKLGIDRKEFKSTATNNQISAHTDPSTSFTS